MNLTGECGSTTVDVPIKSVDWGLTLGGEAVFGGVGLFARYSVGVQIIDDAKQGAQDITNRVASIGVRWGFSGRR